MATSSYLNRTTPGVYITEIDAFGTSIVGVATAVPIFIGYTQFAGDPSTGASLYNTPVSLSSMAEFTSYFGGSALQSYAVAVVPPAPTPDSSGNTAAAVSPAFVANYTTSADGSTPPASGASYTVASTGFTLSATALPGEPNQFNLYWQMLLFYANGGGNCYVVSVGSYWANEFPTSAPNPVPADWFAGSISAGSMANTPPTAGLLVGINAAGYAIGPTMTVVPEACLLDQADYATVVQAMLSQASSLQDRVAILDLPNCLNASTYDELLTCQTNLGLAIAPQAASVSYGVAYAPAVNTSVVNTGDILFTNLVATGDGDNSVINNILTTQANSLYGGAQLETIQGAIAAAFPLGATFGTTNTQQYSVDDSSYPVPTADTAAALSQWQLSLDNLLLNALPIFQQIEQQIANTMNVAPPSGLLAGVWTKSDVQSGVWNAPANIALASVNSPLYSMSDTEQSGFNVPTNGQAIDILRAQPSRGTVVWGARTLDGNSNDYRYVQVRRTLIYVEQSIKTALQAYVFAANDATTWSTVTSAVSSFLTGLWQQGGLMGSKASDAFTVSCGLGTTMTSQNILDGYMIVAVTLQMIHPAEFIELTFTQTMGS
ncbi:MAG: phage tail sheath C-terminal domain-containing protein [Pseudomonadota bacterium]